MKSARFWVPTSILLVLVVLAIGVAIIGKALADDAFAAKDDLEKAMPLVSQVQKSMLEGDTESAKETTAKIAALTSSARARTDGALWHNLGWVPVVGPNLAGVRVAADSADRLVREVVTPLTDVSLDAIVPRGGAIDLPQLAKLAAVVEKASASVATVQKNLSGIDRDALLGPVKSGVDQIDTALGKVEPILEPVHNALTLLPEALGAQGPRNYLLIFQNNAESRGTGGNPAAIALLNATEGKITLAGQVGSSDFKNDLPKPIIDLDPQTKALYGDKIGRYVMDTTLTPDFAYTSKLVQAFWAQQSNVKIDGVASFDPVALSYLLKATGPVKLPTGHTLTSDNAVPLLLNEVYSIFPHAKDQDAFFAGAAAAVFQALLDGHPQPKALLDELARAANEGRLMYSPNDPEELKVIAGTPVSGSLPTTNADATVMGAYVNDITEGKLDYYMQLAVAASSTQCSAKDAAEFTISTTLANTLKPEQVDGLARYISPGRFFAKGTVSTDLVLYGPVDATVKSVTVNGKPASVTSLPHLGRNAVKVNVVTPPSAQAVVVVTYSGKSGPYGPLEIRHTPMVRQTPVKVDTPGC